MSNTAEKLPDEQTYHQLIHELADIKTDIKQLNEQLKQKRAEQTRIEHITLERLDEDGTTKVATDRASVYISETVVPQVEDWDLFYEYIKDNNELYLLQRRVNSTAYKEHLEMGTDIPGLRPYVKRNLNLRNL